MYSQFGKVFKGRRKDTGEIVAIKILMLEDNADEQAFRGVAKEIQMLRDCNHPSIVGFYGSYIKENELWVSNSLSCSLSLSLPHPTKEGN